MWKIIIGLTFLVPLPLLSGETGSSANKPPQHTLYPSNIASLQRGSKYFMNYCSGCHSLQFIRYNRLFTDLKIIDKVDPTTLQRLKNNLLLTGTTANSEIKSSLDKREALEWFGVIPPDLSLSIRARGRDWVYNYLIGFYQDNTRPFGVNNNLIKNTAMPDPLAMLRENAFSSHQKTTNVNNQLFIKIDNNQNRLYSNKNYAKTLKLKKVTTDLVNFLIYTADPTKNSRQTLGIKVCGFLLIFICLVYLLKRKVWGNVK